MKKLLIILLLVAFVSPIDLTEDEKAEIDAFIDYLKGHPNLIIIDNDYGIYNFFYTILKKSYYEMFYYITRGESEEAKNKCNGLFQKPKAKCKSLTNLLIDLYKDYYEKIGREKKMAPYKRKD